MRHNLRESFFKQALKCNTIITFSSLLFNKKILPHFAEAGFLLLFTSNVPRGVFCEQSSQKTRELSLRSKRYFLCLSQEGSFFCASRSMLPVTERTVTDFFQSQLFCAKATLPDRLIMFYFALAAFLSPRKPIDVTQISLSKIINMARKINSTTTILMIAPRASSVQIEPIISTCE